MHHHHEWVHPLFVVLSFLALWFAVTNFGAVKRVLIGRPMRTRELEQAHIKLVWFIALPILAADLYSSVAYGPEAGITELERLGPGAKWFVIPITASTVCLLGILITSYIMGVSAYPNGGGAYAIARDNFRKPWTSLVAASALLTDYILTVAVSVSAGIEAMASAYPVLLPYQTSLFVICVIVIMLVNLRGVSESATVFTWPTFAFMGLMIALIVTGFVNEFRHGFVQPSTPSFGTAPHGLTVLLLLKAFSSACSSLTGIETISNAVPVFREKSKGAIKAYLALGLITGASPGLHRVVLNTVQLAMSQNSDVIAVYVGFDEEALSKMERRWEEWGAPCRLVTLKSEYRSVLGPLSRFIQRVQTWEGGAPDHINLYIGQFVPTKWWHYILHNQTAFMLRAWLLRHRDFGDHDGAVSPARLRCL